MAGQHTHTHRHYHAHSAEGEGGDRESQRKISNLNLSFEEWVSLHKEDFFSQRKSVRGFIYCFISNSLLGVLFNFFLYNQQSICVGTAQRDMVF